MASVSVAAVTLRAPVHLFKELHLLLQRTPAARRKKKWRRGGAFLFIQTAKKDNLTRYGIYPAGRSCLPRLGSFCFMSSILGIPIPAWPPRFKAGVGKDAPGAKPANSGPNCPKVQLHVAGVDSLSPPFTCFLLEKGLIIPLNGEISQGTC